VQEELAEVPPLDVPKELSVTDSLFHLMRQHGDFLADLESVGVPVIELARLSARSRSRTSRWRDEHRRRELQSLDIPAVVEVVRELLRRSVSFVPQAS
jgi:hypothetical protein